MIELNASLRSVQANITQYQTTLDQSAVAVDINGQKSTPSILNNQEKQIVDQVGISAEAFRKYQDAKVLAEQLQNYLDYLNGNKKGSQVRITANDNKPDVTISGQASQLAASVTIASYTEETLNVNAKFDDAGNLQELTINKSTISEQYIKADISLDQQQFFASIG